MASVSSDVADSPDVKSSRAGTPATGTSINGGTGTKRAMEEDSADVDQISSTGTAAVKKKKSGPGSRGVANLTPEQLAKKRANDREAQRAIRERTKNQIETLERRIQELTSQKPYQELQAVIRAKEAVEQENVDTKRQLAGVINVLRPLAGLGDTMASPQAHSQSGKFSQSPGPSQHGLAPVTRTAATSATSVTASEQQRASPAWTDSQPPSLDRHQDPTLSQLHHQMMQLRQGFNMMGERLGLELLLKPGQRVNRVQAGPNGAQDSPQYHHLPVRNDWHASSGYRDSWSSPRADVSRESPTLGQDAYAKMGTLTGITSQQQQPQLHTQHSPRKLNGNVPVYAIPVKNCEPTCPLDTILLNFLSERHQRIAEGLNMHDVMGPRYPSVSSLLNPATSAYSHPLSKLFTDVLSAFPDISRLPERIAIVYIMFLLMRWQISPTRENYERLPDWMLPGQAQLEVPHPAWIDHIPFPAMRERLVRIYGPRQYDLDQFFIPYTATLQLSWPYEETDALLLLPDSEELVMNPVFERHLRNIDNWKLGRAFAASFPALADTFSLDTSR